MKNTIPSLITSLLIILYCYAAISKLLTFADFRQQLYNQAFSQGLAGALLYLLPAAETGTALLLCFRRTLRAGLLASLLLLVLFTGYISLVMLHYWDRLPCSCGGILSHMSWTAHLMFNWAFLILNLIAIYLQPAERKRQVRFND